MMLQKHKALIITILIFIGAFILKIECPIYKLTGLYCPGCGITRMFISLFELKIYQAFRYNPLLFIYLVLLILYGLYYIILKCLHKNPIKISNKILYAIIVITILFGLLRNINLFSWLAPTIIN